MAGVQYTSCVQPGDYKPLKWKGEGFFVGLGLGISPIAVSAYLYHILSVCDYLLSGKLVCLKTKEGSSEVCAIGHVAQIEEVGYGKPFPKNIDNDYAINLLLAPHGLEEFAHGSRKDNYDKVANDPDQGYLIKEQDGMPIPREPLPPWGTPTSPSSLRYGAYTTSFLSSSYISYDPKDVPFQVPGSDTGFEVPVLHCEFEGSRTHDICSTLKGWSGLGSGLCDSGWFGKLLCSIIGTILLPVMWTALIVAWIQAKEGEPNTARLDPGSGTINLGDSVLITGRWVYDAGHSGYNEIHAVHTIQKVGEEACTQNGYADQHLGTRWCNACQEVPPSIHLRPVAGGMTPQQLTVFNNQRRPENRWILHPFVDGCEPRDQPPVIK